MNNLIIKSKSRLQDEVSTFIKENGKYGLALIGTMYICNLIHNVIVKAIDNGCNVDLQVSKEKIDLKIITLANE